MGIIRISHGWDLRVGYVPFPTFKTVNGILILFPVIACFNQRTLDTIDISYRARKVNCINSHRSRFVESIFGDFHI